jgi:antitoxin component of RelBE/YafQ-DinJ toxin-antitoxin module
MAKEITFKMRLDETDKARFDELAEHYGAPVATVIRMVMKRDADALGIGPAKKAAKRPSKPAKKGAGHGR